MTAHERRLARLMVAASEAKTPAEAFQCVRDAYLLGLELVPEYSDIALKLREIPGQYYRCGNPECAGIPMRAVDLEQLHEFVDDRSKTATQLMLQVMRR